MLTFAISCLAGFRVEEIIGPGVFFCFEEALDLIKSDLIIESEQLTKWLIVSRDKKF